MLDQRRARLAENGEDISDARFEDIMLRGITSNDDYIRNTSYRDPKFRWKDVQTTMRRMYIDVLPRKEKSRDVGWPGQLITPPPPPRVNFGLSTVTNPDIASLSALTSRMSHQYPL